MRLLRKSLCIIISVLMIAGCFSACAKYPKALEDYLVEYSASELKSSNGVLEPYFTENIPTLEGTQYLQDYIQSDAASEEFKALYTQADRVEPIPVYGAYLESTSVQALLFWKGSTLLGIKCVIVSEDTDARITEFSTYLGTTQYEYCLNDESCYSNMQTHLRLDPGLRLIGLVMRKYAAWGIGFPSGEDHMAFFALGGVSPIRQIEPFSVVADGAKAFEAYWEEHAKIRSSIPVWQWNNNNVPNGYISKYYHTAGKRPDYLIDYDTSIGIPLLDYNGNEKVYFLHLLYSKNRLIAEVILEDKQGGNGGYVVAVKERVAEKDPVTGEYEPLTTIDYVDAVEKLLAKSNRDAEVKGIGYNGKKFQLIYEE